MGSNIFQNYVIESLEATLNKCIVKRIPPTVLKSDGALKTFKSGYIAHYASMYRDNKSQDFVNLWQNSNIRHCKGLLMTENAYNIIEKIYGKNEYKSNRKEKDDSDRYSYNKYKNKLSQKEANKEEVTKNLLYWEHITPNSVVWDKMIELYNKHYISKKEISIDSLKQCFEQHRIILMTKYEAKKLDGNGGKTGIGLMNGRNTIAELRIDKLFSGSPDVKSLVLYKNNSPLIYKYGDVFDNEKHFKGDVKKYFDDEYTFELN